MIGRSKPFLFTAALALLASGAAHAVPRLKPPTQFLDDDERYRVVVAEIAEITEGGRFRLSVVKELRGETPDGLIVRVLGGGDAGLEVGKTYILGHTDKPGRRSHRWSKDPEGSRFLGIPAVGNAIFADSPAMRALTRVHLEEEPLGDRERLAAVLDVLETDDAQSQRFVTAELALDDELRELVSDAELERLRAALASEHLDPVSHEYLLRAALPMIDSWGGDWLAASAREVAAGHGADLDLASPIPALLVTVFRTLELTGTEADAELARRHVPSNNPGVGKAAFQALVALDRRLAGEVAATVGDADDLHPDTRRFVSETAAREALGSDAG